MMELAALLNHFLSKKYKQSQHVANVINCVKIEVEKLHSELEGAEKRYQEDYIQSTFQIRSAYEFVEQTQSKSGKKVSTLEANLEQSKVKLEALKAKITKKDFKLKNISEENKFLNAKLEKTELTTKIDTTKEDTEVTKLVANFEDIQRVMLEKETELKNITEENELLEMEKNNVNDEAMASA
ncbi:interactor of constitutive active ROPs 2, chloroplastic-like protein [Tanacetum coccineum]